MDPDTPWITDADVLGHVTHLVGCAMRRQTWIFPVDDVDGSASCIRVEGMPADPDPDEVAHFAEVLDQVGRHTGADALVLVWERPGGPDLQMLEADWVAAVAAVAASGAPIRAQLLAHDDGVRLLDVAFEAVVAA